MKNYILIIFLSSFIYAQKNDQNNIYETILNHEFSDNSSRVVILNYQLMKYHEYKKLLCEAGIYYEKNELLCSFKDQSTFKNINHIHINRKHEIFYGKDITKYDYKNYKEIPFGVTQFSNILDTKISSNLKLVYIENYSSEWDGFGKFYLMEKRNNKWYIKKVYFSWVA